MTAREIFVTSAISAALTPGRSPTMLQDRLAVGAARRARRGVLRAGAPFAAGARPDVANGAVESAASQPLALAHERLEGRELALDLLQPLLPVPAADLR